MKRVLSIALCTIILSGCGNVVNPSTNNVDKKTDVIEKSNVEKKYKYDLPLKLTAKDECGGNSKTLYEIKDGIFTYNLNEEVFGGTELSNDLQTRKLTDEEINVVKKLLDEVSIASLAEKDLQLPTDGPQTLECRSIEGLTIMVNGQEKFFQKNERAVKHTQEYIDGLTKIKQVLSDLKAKSVKTVELNKEFNLKIGESVTFENNILKVDSLTEESRCPGNVQCIQAGQVSFKFKFIQQFMQENEFTLTSRAGNAELAIKKINSYTFTLVKVLPESFEAGKAPQPSDYILTLKIIKS